MPKKRSRYTQRIVMTLLCLFFVMSKFCHAQVHDVLCSDGDGNFEAEFHTGVKLHVGAARNGGLATRTCEATFTWNQQTLVVMTGVSQLDVDAFGVDLNLGVPVAAFQVKRTDRECCTEYQIYSLEKPPRLLLSIAGGSFFSAADTDLDGRIEIWTDDAAATVGFENLAMSELDFAPPIVLRFADGKLLDVSSEFQPSFDRKIAEVRKQLDSADLRDFKSSDGKLSPLAQLSVDRLHHLRGVKVKVLEIVWSYLYSGREQQAWRTLADMWPPADTDRIRAAILSARARGIGSRVNGVSTVRPGSSRKHATIFDSVSESGGSKREVVPPAPMLLRYPPPVEISDQHLADSEVLLDLVIDAAGKVRSAELAGKARSGNADLINAALGWKFIPAFKAGRAVASRLRLAVSLKR